MANSKPIAGLSPRTMLSIARQHTLPRRTITQRLSCGKLRHFHPIPPNLASDPAPRNPTSSPAIFRATGTDVYPFGVPSNERSRAWFVDLNWEISSNSCWAILSAAPTSTTTSRSNLISTVLHQARYDPVGSASHPILETLPAVERSIEQGSISARERTVEDLIQCVTFKTRLGGSAKSGEFDDYTARYYSIRDEDKLTTRQHLKDSLAETPHVDDLEIERMAKSLRMEELLDLPLITLSNGQTRRARILRALLQKPELLILEEPFTGLDKSSREFLVSLLASLHSTGSPRILLVLRPQDSLPSFVSHLALVDGTEPNTGPATVKLGSKQAIMQTKAAKELFHRGDLERLALQERKERRQQQKREREEVADRTAGGQARKALIALKDVNVVYGRKDGTGTGKERPVLRDVSWTIREGEKWVLAGHNGSGKSTLLSIILGDHPRSFTEDVTLFDKPRYRQATSTIQQSIGHVSPEIFNAFPRKYGPQGLTAYDTIVTGFESIYSYRSPTPEQEAQIASLLTSFDHPLVTPSFLSKLFASLTAGEQSLVLLLRALVKQPKLLVLDEPFQGMDQETVQKVKDWLTRTDGTGIEPGQSVVLISHFEEEIPDEFDRRIELENGAIKELI